MLQLVEKLYWIETAEIIILELVEQLWIMLILPKKMLQLVMEQETHGPLTVKM